MVSDPDPDKWKVSDLGGSGSATLRQSYMRHSSIGLISVVDPDPDLKGSELFGRIRSE